MTYDFKESRAPEEGGRWMRVRVALVGAALLMGLSGDLLRAVQLQVFERARFLDMAEGKYLRQVEIPARRGDVFDRLQAYKSQNTLLNWDVALERLLEK